MLAALDGELQQLYDALGEPFRPRFFPVVQQLRALESSTVSELAALTGVSQPAMTQTLAEMRRRGLVASEKNRRVRLTAEGAALCARLEPVWRAVEAAAAELDRELSEPLGATIAAALSRLAERPLRRADPVRDGETMKAFLAAAAALLLSATAAPARDFAPDEQAEVIRAAAALIEERYVDATRAEAIADALRRMAEDRHGPMEGEAFAQEMTERFRAASSDGHLGLSYSEAPIPEQGGDAQFDAGEMDKWYGPQLNHGVEKIERLEGNVMLLLDLRVFPPVEMGGDVFAAAMTVVAQGKRADRRLAPQRRRRGNGRPSHRLPGRGRQPVDRQLRPAERHPPLCQLARVGPRPALRE